VDFGGGNKNIPVLFVCLFLLTFVNWWVALADNGSTSMRSFSFCFFFHRSYYILKKLKENILLFFCLLACSYMSLWFCFSFSHCQDKDDSDDSLTTQAFTESGFSLHPVCLSSQDDVVVFFVSHFSSGFVLLQKISIQQ
jgi:hypothetical protein